MQLLTSEIQFYPDAKTFWPTFDGKGKPIPKTKDGKIDGSKLVSGETYVDSNGVRKIWNGTSFQPVRE